MHHYVCHPGNPETTDLSVPRITVGLTGKALQDASTVNAAAEDRAAARSAGDVPSRLVQAPAQPQRKVRCRFDKTFHVSPFMDMDQQCVVRCGVSCPPHGCAHTEPRTYPFRRTGTTGRCMSPASSASCTTPIRRAGNRSSSPPFGALTRP